jgi:glycosyltransferase involved in cell wall biosynthesis
VPWKTGLSAMSTTQAPHIVITNGWGLGTPSGVARHVQELARHLGKEGARVTVVCVSTSHYTSFPRPPLPEALEGHEVEADLARHGVRVERVAPHALHWALDGRPVLAAVRRIVDRERVDAVLGFFNEAAHLPDFLARRGIPFGFVATWLSYRMALSRERTGHGWRGTLRRATNRHLVVGPYRRAPVLFANSEFTRRELIEVVGCDPARVRVTYLGVRSHFHDLTRTRPEQVERVLYFGRLAREKGIGDALEALGRLARDGRRFSFRVLGSGNVEHVRSQANRLGIGEQVEFLPHQGDRALRRELERAHLALLPSHSESFGLSIAEAQAAGLPVVAYAAGSVPEVVEDGRSAWLAPLGDVEALTAALGAALDDPDEVFRRGLVGRERVQRLFRWSRTARAVLDGLAEIAPSSTAFQAA